MSAEFIVVSINENEEYEDTLARTYTLTEAYDAQYNAYKQGDKTDILKLCALKDVYGVETDQKAWIPVDVLIDIEKREQYNG